MHLTDKRDLLLKFEELDAKVKSDEAQYAIEMSFLEVDQERMEK